MSDKRNYQTYTKKSKPVFNTKPFIQQPFGANKFRSDARAQNDMLSKMAKCNTLTIC